MSLFPTINSYSSWDGGIGWQIAQQVDEPTTDKPVKPNELVRRPNLGWMGGAYGVYGGLGYLGAPAGYTPPPAMTDNTMRLMSMHSTLAFVFANISQPIVAGCEAATFEVNPAFIDKSGGPGGEELAKWQKVIDAAMRPLLGNAIQAACRALQYGRWTQQVIFDRVDGYTIPVRFKTFLPWEIYPLMDPYGDFAGVRYQGVEIDRRYLFHHVNCPELDPIFGFTRHWNVIQEWWTKFQNAIQLAKLAQKAASIVPIIKGPQGNQPNPIPGGEPISGLTTSKAIAAALSRGEPVYMPQYLLDDEDIQRSPELAKFTAFDIDRLDLGEQGPTMAAIQSQQTYADVCFSRGWHQPERASMEGQHGTKAEAGTHKVGSVEDCESVQRDAYASLSRRTVNETLRTNWGQSAVDAIVVKGPQLQDASQSYKQQAVIALFSDKTTGPDAQLEVDKRALFEQTELPLRDPKDVAADREKAKADAAELAKQNAQKPPANNATAEPQEAASANGNGHTRLVRFSTRSAAEALLNSMLEEQWEQPAIALADEDGDCHWVTINGAKVCIGGDGTIQKGPHHLIGKTPEDVEAHGAAPAKKKEGFHQIERDATGKYKGTDSEIAKRMEEQKLPPGWKNVHLSEDPEAKLQATGEDSKGRTQYRYSTEHTGKAAADKFERVREFMKKLEGVRDKLDADPSEEAAALKLVDKTGLRIGSDADTGAEKQAYGASTLRSEHVVTDADGATRLKFTGKKGVDIDQKISDPELANDLKERAKSGGKLYNTTDAKMRQKLHEVAPGFKVKDFRTAVAADAGMKAVKSMPVPTDEKGLLAAKKAVGKIVADRLGNTPAVALKSYIPPETFGAWESRVANKVQATAIMEHAKATGMKIDDAARDWIGKNAKSFREGFEQRQRKAG